ncbi:MAG: helix-turn-helix domain-containing protein [Candidatus Levyibacteriota bacterium]
MVKLGQRLHTLRLQRKLTLEQVAAEIKIRSSFLAAIERSEYNKLPSPAYAQGFVRNYASYLGLSRAEITALFKREFDEKRAYKVLPDSLVKTQEFPLQRMRIQQSLMFFVVILILVVGYLFMQYRAAFLPPSLAITTPKTDSTTSQEITVTGKADSNATVTINDQPVAVSSAGEFSKQITLFPGSATISVKATNRFGKVTSIQRNITVH